MDSRPADRTPDGGTLVGRQHEIAELTAALSDVLAGRGRVSMISGEAGIGKTRLVQEAARRAIVAGARVWWGRCWEGGGAPPYWPWIQILREALRVADRSIGEINSAAERVIQALPEIASIASGPNAQTSVGSTSEDTNSAEQLPSLDTPKAGVDLARFRLFDSVSSILRLAAAVAPLMIVLDDLHAADIDSLLLLKFIARDVLQSRILIAGTYRDAEVNQSPSHASILGEVGREGQNISLRGLSEDAAATLVRNHTGIDADNALIASLYQASGGNPFFLDEIVRVMVVESRFDGGAKRGGSFTIPNSVRSAVRRNLAAIPPKAQEALSVASVIGQEFDLSTLAEVLGVPVHATLELLERALALGIVDENPGTATRFRFVHAIIPEALRADLGKAQAMRLHLRIAEAIERLNGGDLTPHYAQLAHHFGKAITFGGADKAGEYARLGAERARAQLAYEESARLNQLALQAHSARADSLPAERCELLLALADAQSKAGSLADAKGAFLEAANIARQLKRPDLLARAALEASTGLGTFFVVDQDLITLLEEAVRAIGDSDPALLSLMLARLAHELEWSDRREYALTLCQRSIALARTTDNVRALISALWAEHVLTWAAANVDKRLATADEIGELASRAGSVGWRLRSHEMRLSALLELGDIGAVDAELDAVQHLKSAAGFDFSTVDRFRPTRLLMKGEFERAETLIGEWLHEAQRHQDAALITTFTAQLMMVRTEQGRVEELESQQKGLALQFPAMVPVRIALALFYARAGRNSEAQAELDFLARTGFARIANDYDWLFSVSGCAEVAAALGDVERAAILYPMLEKYGGRNVTIGWGDICYGAVSRYLGQLSTALGRVAQAEKHFENALRLERAMGAPPFVARTLVSYAAMLLGRSEGSDRECARQHLDEALEISVMIGMSSIARRAKALAGHAASASTDSAAQPARGTAHAGEAPARRLATIMFLDIVNSTGNAARLGDRGWSVVLDDYYARVRGELKRFGGTEVNTFGDDFFALFDSPTQAVRCAGAIRNTLRAAGVEIRAGLHTGECEISGRDVGGIAVHIGARIIREAEPGVVVVSSTVKDLVAGAGFEFTDRGTKILRGVPGEWRLFEAIEAKSL